MNALLRRKYEVPVVDNTSIEVHIAPLKESIDDLKQDVRELRASHAALGAKVDNVAARVEEINESLRDKVDSVRDSLSGKIDLVRDSLSARMDSVRDELSGRIDSVRDELSAKIDVNQRSTEAKIAECKEAVASMRGLQFAMLWVVGGLGSAVILVFTIGNARHWF